jgi:hypothetical protein
MGGRLLAAPALRNGAGGPPRPSGRNQGHHTETNRGIRCCLAAAEVWSSRDLGLGRCCNGTTMGASLPLDGTPGNFRISCRGQRARVPERDPVALAS